jgi:hypothetical protein
LTKVKRIINWKPSAPYRFWSANGDYPKIVKLPPIKNLIPLFNNLFLVKMDEKATKFKENSNFEIALLIKFRPSNYDYRTLQTGFPIVCTFSS